MDIPAGTQIGVDGRRVPIAELPTTTAAEEFAARQAALYGGGGGGSVDRVVVANAAARLALSSTAVQPGDVAVQTDTGRAWLLIDADPSVVGNWRQIDDPVDRVVVANAAARLALSSTAVQPGDVAVQTDTGRAWLLIDADPSIAGNWREIDDAVVTSVNGQTGAVSLATTDPLAVQVYS